MNKAAIVLGLACLLGGYACSAHEDLFTGGDAVTASGAGGQGSGAGGAQGQGAGPSNSVTVGPGSGPGGGPPPPPPTSGPGGRGQGGFGEGGMNEGGVNEGGSVGVPACNLPNFCSEADPSACVCEGCNNNGQCGQNEDCVCPDCQNAQACQSCGMGGPNGSCNPYFEGCNCSDCALHPLCMSN